MDIVTSFARFFSSSVGTSIVSPSIGATRGLEGNPTMVNTMPAMSVGVTGYITSGQWEV